MTENAKIRALPNKMTTEEKVSLLGCGADFSTRALPRLGIPSVALPVDTFPSLTALGCTFDRNILEEYGRVLSAEAVASGKALGGPLNLGVIRCPMQKGSERMLGEDPLAVGELASAAAGAAKAASVKLIGCGLLGGEYPFSERNIDGRALMELYLRPFFKTSRLLGGVIVPEGTLGGKPCGVSRELISVLADALDETAFLTNAAGATTDKPGAVSAGVCFQPIDHPLDRDALCRAVEDGTVPQARLDEAAERLLSFVFSSRVLTGTRGAVKTDGLFYRRLAEKSTVLLKNDAALPLAPGARVGVCGDVSKADCAPLSSFLTLRFGRTDEKNQLIFLRPSGEEFTSGQTAMVRRAASGGGNAIVVLLADRPVPLPFEADASALLYVPASVPAFREAIAAVGGILTGLVNPGGKLNVSYACSPADYPANAYRRAAGRGMFCYESVLNGYRYFDSFSRPVLYPFGHGLSYTGFRLSRLKAAAAGAALVVEFTVKNVGPYAGETVAFVFASLPGESVFGLKSRLAGFKRLSLGIGESTDVRMSVPLSELSVYDCANGSFPVPGGKYTVSAGFSAADLRARTQAKLPGQTRLNLGLTQKTVPSYFTEGAFRPLGRDVERVLGVPLLSRRSDQAAALVPPGEKEGARLKKAFVKKLKKAGAVTEEEAARMAELLSAYALKEICGGV